MVERILILVAVAAGVALLILAGRALVAARRRRALAAAPFAPAEGAGEVGPVRVLAFSTPQCQQCRLLQKPALAEVAAQTEQVEILSIDALEEPELAERYGIMVVPSTVVLAPNGKASAVNYGFAPARILKQQIEGARIALAR